LEFVANGADNFTFKEQVFEQQRKLEGTQLRLNLLPKYENQIQLLKTERVLLNERLHSLLL
jgi:hypothetical protein